MTLILAATQLIIIIIICIYEYYKKSASVFMWAVCLIMFGIMHFQIVISGSNIYPSDVLNNASLFVIGFCCIYLIVRFILLRNNEAITIDIGTIESKFIHVKCQNYLQDKKFVRIMLVLLVVTVSYKLYVLISVSGGIVNTSWGSMYNYYVNEDYISFSKVIMWIYYPCSSVVFIGLYKKNRKLYIISGAIIVIYALISRSRADLLPMLCSVIALFVFKKEKLKVRKVLLYLSMGFFSIYIVYALRVFRHYGTIGDFITTFSFYNFNNRITDEVLSGDGELGLLQVFYHFIYYNNNFPNFGKGHTYLRMLLALIPTRFSFGFKPPDFAISMGSAWLNNFNNTNFSTHPTLFGDCYANLGYLGIFLGVFWAAFVFILDKLINRKNILVKLALLSIICYNYVLIARGSVYNSYTSIIYGTIIIACIFFVSRIRYR